MSSLLLNSFGLGILEDEEPSLTIREIAQICGWSPSKVAKLRKRALIKLSKVQELKFIFENNQDLRAITYASNSTREGQE